MQASVILQRTINSSDALMPYFSSLLGYPTSSSPHCTPFHELGTSSTLMSILSLGFVLAFATHPHLRSQMPLRQLNPTKSVVLSCDINRPSAPSLLQFFFFLQPSKDFGVPHSLSASVKLQSTQFALFRSQNDHRNLRTWCCQF
jgi:hypothetical protein